MGFLKKIAGLFITKKRVISWGAAVILAIGAAAASMKTEEFKEAVCGAAVIDQVESSK